MEKQRNNFIKTNTEHNRMVLDRCFQHKTLEERAAEYDGKLNLEGELDWRGDSVGNEIL